MFQMATLPSGTAAVEKSTALATWDYFGETQEISRF